MKMSARILWALRRRKTELVTDDDTGPLSRCLGLYDLTALGIGGTLGLGAYVLAGAVAKTVAGPAVCISFLVAAVASAAAGVCYAEFAARVPKAGSAYVYSYVTIGEFVAYVIGWNLLLEYIIGTASVARGLSNYLDALADKQIREGLRAWFPIDIDFLSPYPDFLALGFVLLLTVLLSVGVKESSRLNNLFTVLNLSTVLIVIVSGSIKADTANWSIPKSQIPAEYANVAGEGGFAPFGVAGIMAGAAKCFYGFVGFDAVATTGEEAKDPQKNIPLAIVISLFVIFATYFSISMVLTLMWPYYLQDADAPFPYVFDAVGWPVIKWIVTLGAVFALCTSMLGAMFPLPRVIYAMASDGLLFRKLSNVNPRTQTPVLATIISGVLSGIMAMMFDLDKLIDMMSIGTLMAYTIVAVSVLILRYQVDQDKVIHGFEKSKDAYPELSLMSNFKDLFNLNNNKEPSTTTSHIMSWSIVLFSIFTALFCALVINVPSQLFIEPYYLVGFAITLIAMLILITVIARQPVVEANLSFKVPLVPLIPCLSVFFNLYLMLELDVYTWIRFVIWLVIGLLIYFFYGMKHSEEGVKSATRSKLENSEKQVTKF